MKLFICMLMLPLLTACSSVGLFVANLPVRFNDVQIIRDISYGSDPGQKLDLYLPANLGSKIAPVIIFTYGGRWQSGRRGEYAFVGDSFARRGYIVVIPDYRKYPAVHFPVFVQDVAAATAWTYGQIGKYGGDPNRLFLSGHSAGAQIAALVATNPAYLAAYRLSQHQIIKGFAGLAGPYDFTPEAPDIKAIFPPAAYHDMCVTNFIDGQQPPMLLLRGADDDVVAAYNHERLARRIEEKGGSVEVKTYGGIDHVWIVAALAWFGPARAPVAADVTEFFSRIGKNGAGPENGQTAIRHSIP